MDDIDRKLVGALQKDATLTHEKLADIVGSSPSAIHRRVHKLKSAGVIEGYVVKLNPKALGLENSFVVGLDIERKNSQYYEDLKLWLKAEDSVQQAYNVTGSADFILIVTARSLEAYDELMSRLVEENPNVRKFTTSVVLQTFKSGIAYPVNG